MRTFAASSAAATAEAPAPAAAVAAALRDLDWSGHDIARRDGRPAGPRAVKRVVVSGIPSDSHTWSLVFLQLLLEEHCCAVTNLGPCTPIELVVQTCLDQRPDALIVSTVNGHGHIEGRELVEAVRRHAALARMTAVIGGKLGTLGPDNVRFAGPLLDAGYDAVFGEGDRPQGLIDMLCATPIAALAR
jgi:methylmalonyl-CoA mutase cobalamin-binding subunit